MLHIMYWMFSKIVRYMIWYHISIFSRHWFVLEQSCISLHKMLILNHFKLYQHFFQEINYKNILIIHLHCLCQYFKCANCRPIHFKWHNSRQNCRFCCNAYNTQVSGNQVLRQAPCAKGTKAQRNLTNMMVLLCSEQCCIFFFKKNRVEIQKENIATRCNVYAARAPRGDLFWNSRAILNVYGHSLDIYRCLPSYKCMILPWWDSYMLLHCWICNKIGTIELNRSRYV
jgi:hypothetical protein